MTIRRVEIAFILIVLVLGSDVATWAEQGPDEIAVLLASKDAKQIEKAVQKIRARLEGDPVAAVDQLNEVWMAALLRARQFDVVNEVALTGTIAVASDTWRIEQLQKYRVQAMLAKGNAEGALHAAKALFNVCGMRFTKDSLPLLASALEASHPDDRSIVAKFKLQVLANAQENPDERKRLNKKYGGNSVMESIAAEPDLYRDAIKKRRARSDYRGLYGTGNLLLMAGRVTEAHDIFSTVYRIAPPNELKYASEGIAKLIKCEEGGLGKANQFVMSVRPKE